MFDVNQIVAVTEVTRVQGLRFQRASCSKRESATIDLDQKYAGDDRLWWLVN